MKKFVLIKEAWSHGPLGGLVKYEVLGIFESRKEANKAARDEEKLHNPATLTYTYIYSVKETSLKCVSA